MAGTPGAQVEPVEPRRRTGPTWLAVFLATVYVACLANPLTRLFDFDVNLVLAPAAAVGGAVFGATRPRKPRRERNDVRATVGRTGPGTVYARLLLEGLAALAAILVLAATTRIFFPWCGFFWGMVYFLLGPVFSMAFGLSVGLAATLLARGTGRAAVLAAGVVLATLLYPTVRALFVPVAFAYNPTFGFFPGPVYDPVATVEPAYLWARLHTVLIVAAVVSGTDIALYLGKYVPAPRSVVGSGLALAISLPAAIVLGILGDRAGISSSISAIERELDGTAATAHFVVHYPAEGRTARQIQWVAADLEAAYSDLSATLDVDVEEPIHAYIYPSRGAKKRLMGAGRTSVAFPRSRSLHLNADTYPHPVLVHELAHVMSGSRGMPLIEVSPLPGLTEGLAVAQEEVTGDLTVHEWAAAMARIGKLPDVAAVLSVTGFWQHPGGIAYTACGSFVRYLIETRGIERFWAAYRWGRIAAAYGSSIETLVNEWEAFLDTVEVSDEALARARYRFSSRGLFGTPCARAKDRLKARADDLFVRSRPRAAAETYHQAAEMAGGDPRLLRAALRAWLAADANLEARQLAELLLADAGDLGALQRVPIEVMLAAAEYRLGDLASAKQHWEAAASVGVATSDVRRATCLSIAANEPARLSSVIAYLAREPRAGADLLRLAEAWRDAPTHPVVTYLLARRFQMAERWTKAVDFYGKALDAGLPGAFLEREALRNRAICALFTEDATLARDAARTLATHPGATRADRVLSRRLLERLAIVAAGPIVPARHE